MIDISKGIQNVIVKGGLEAVVDVSSYHASTHKDGSEERKFDLKKGDDAFCQYRNRA
jgi:hypothetical protein